jgi:hypothetical protein
MTTTRRRHKLTKADRSRGGKTRAKALKRTLPDSIIELTEKHFSRGIQIDVLETILRMVRDFNQAEKNVGGSGGEQDFPLVK